MAVFPDRIVLKSSTDLPESIIAQIDSEGVSPIIRGEIVVSVQDGYTELYTVDANGDIVGAASQLISSQGDVELSSDVPNNAILTYDQESGVWRDAVAPPFSIEGNILGDLGNVTETGRYDGASLIWLEDTQSWTPSSISFENINGIKFYDPDDVAEGHVLQWMVGYEPIYGSEGEVVGTVEVAGWGNGFIDYDTIPGRPTWVSDLGMDIRIEDLNGVSDYINPQVGDVLTWNGTEWVTSGAPPVDISGSSIALLNDVEDYPVDVQELSSLIGGTLRFTLVDLQPFFEITRLSYYDLDSRPTLLSNFTNDLLVSDFTNDAQYISLEDGFDLGEVTNVTITDPQQSQILIYRSNEWVNDFGPPADITFNSIGDLLDVTYFQPGTSPGVLTIANLGTIEFDSPLVGSGYFYRNTYDREYGIGLEALRESDLSGSAVYADRSRGVTLRSDVNIVRLTGRPTTITNQPELRFESGDDGGDIASGSYIGLKMPANVEPTDSITYLLPSRDGDFGDVLITDGEGGMSWTTNAAGISLLSQLDDVDLSTPPPSDGQALIYNGTLGLWMPGNVSDIDISSASIGDLSDVDLATNPPQASQGLVWDGTSWVAGNTSSVVTWEVRGVTDDSGYAYSLSGAGIENAELNPDLYVFRGQRYRFSKDEVAHPFRLEDVNGAIYSTGVEGGQPLLLGDLFWEVPLDAPTTLYYQCTAHSSMRGTIHVLSESVVASINDLTDVDTLSTPPSSGDVLEWNGARWVPAEPSAGNGAGVDRTSEVQVSTAGLATFSAIGRSGVLVSISSTADAWITLYSTQSARTADSARLFEEDPLAGSGILAEVYTSGGGTVTATPGTTYFNAEAESPDEIYASVRTKLGAPVASDVTVQAFPIASGSNSGVSVAELKYIMGQSSTFEEFKTLVLAM